MLHHISKLNTLFSTDDILWAILNKYGTTHLHVCPPKSSFADMLYSWTSMQSSSANSGTRIPHSKMAVNYHILT